MPLDYTHVHETEKITQLNDFSQSKTKIVKMHTFLSSYNSHANLKSQNFRAPEGPTAMYQHRCLNVQHLTFKICFMSSLLCALPHTILPCGHISISCFYVTCLLPVLRSFAQ